MHDAFESIGEERASFWKFGAYEERIQVKKPRRNIRTTLVLTSRSKWS